MNQHVKDFIKVLDSIKPSKNRYEVFSDWLIMSAASLYAPWKKCQKTENEYLEIANQYTKEEIDKHGDLLAITVNALEDEEQDFLGDVFTQTELTNSRTGQFFTPYHVSYMMAEITIGDPMPPLKGKLLRINEPCCGAGGMMIASIAVLKKRGFNYQQDAYFIGQDIDARCARMAYIQLSLLAAPAVIICGNTLTLEVYWERETIGFHMAGTKFRLRAEAMLDFIANTNIQKDEELSAPETIITLPPSGNFTQGELFL